MNFLTCRKCGTKLMSIDSRLNDLHEYKQELMKELDKIRPNKSLKFRVKEIHIELDTINSQIAKEKKIVLLESKLADRNALIVEILKEHVPREQFMDAVNKANKKYGEYQKCLNDERNRLYGFAKDISERRSNRNIGGYVDKTASEAIRNVDRRR